MAYTQKPGRGNGPKTGGGLPAQLNSGSTNAIDPFNSAMPDPGAFAKDSDKMTYDERKANSTYYNPKSEKFISKPLGEGVIYDKNTNKYVPEPVTAKFEKGLGTGKPIGMGTTNLHVGKNFVGNVRKGSDMEKEAYSKFVGDSLMVTGNRRVRAMEYNQKMKNLPAPNKEFYDSAKAYNENIANKTIAEKVKKGTVKPREQHSNSWGEAPGQKMRMAIFGSVTGNRLENSSNIAKGSR